jgi:hypothetical protein
MPTFLVTQGCGKERVINDGRAGGQNHWSEMLETIFAISVDFLAVAAFTILDQVRELWTGLDAEAALADLAAAMPAWAELSVSLDDIPDAYNGVPVWPPPCSSQHYLAVASGKGPVDVCGSTRPGFRTHLRGPNLLSVTNPCGGGSEADLRRGHGSLL